MLNTFRIIIKVDIKKFIVIKFFLCLIILGQCITAQNLPITLNNIKPNSRPRTVGEKQNPKEDFRIRADLVTLPVNILGPNGNTVLGLTKDDFEIFEDGTLQPINGLVSEETLPLKIALMIDTSSSVRNRLQLEQEAAASFLSNVLRYNDQAAIYNFNHDIFLRQDLTNNLSALKSSLQGLQAKGGTAIYDAVFLGSQRLNREKGRRILIIISDGSNTISKSSEEHVLEEISRTGVLVYGVCPGTPPVYKNINNQIETSALEILCKQTGGKMFYAVSVENLNTSFNQLISELRAQYILSYYSSNDTQDGKFRKIEVKIKHPGAQIRTRDGYYAPKE